MKTIQEQIKELELSIASLDNDLERFEIERMKDKTRQVVNRMNKVLGQTENNEMQDILKISSKAQGIFDGNVINLNKIVENSIKYINVFI